MTKIDILSGFLGAGKTTLIKKLIAEAYQGEKLVLIENEFGEVGIDGGFLKDAGIQITEMNSGCICCSLVGDFGKNLHEVIEKFHPDRILIEPSGVGKLSDVMKSVIDVEKDEDVKLNGLITVVNALKASKQMKAFGEFFNNQVEDAKSIIISKVENLEDEKIIEVYNLLKNKNPHANIILANLPHTDEKKLLEVLEKNALITEQMKENLEQEHCCHHHDEEHEHCCHHHDEKGHHHDADEIFVSYGFESVRAYSKEELTHILDALKDENVCGLVLRAKGILRASDNDNWYYFDYVSGDYQINEGKEDFIGRFVVIGSKLNKKNIEKIILIK